MKSYSSFFIRCRIVLDGEEERFVFDIEHIQKGGQTRIRNPAEAIDWIIKLSRAERAGAERARAERETADMEETTEEKE